MLPYNDELAHPQTELSCTVCAAGCSADQAYWYEIDSALLSTYFRATEDGTPTVPVCPSCHADPTSWLPPAYNDQAYLAQRACERLPDAYPPVR